MPSLPLTGSSSHVRSLRPAFPVAHFLVKLFVQHEQAPDDRQEEQIHAVQHTHEEQDSCNLDDL